jgi:peptidyl-prolyl cis-trans isomerase SurA
MGRAVKERMTTKHNRHKTQGPLAGRLLAAPAFQWTAFSAALLCATAAMAQQPRYPTPGGGGFSAPVQQLQLPPMPVTPAITPNGAVVEGVVARVNDQIITRSEYERAEQGILQEALQSKANEAELQSRLNNLLRDMIDRQLLLSKGKTLGINCDADVVRQLDEIRKSNHLDSMEALEKAATQQGVSFEDFKQQIREQCITQQVVREEVGRRLTPTRAQEEAYYAAHASDFTVPEQVHLSEILVPTPDNATEADIAAAQAKADAIAAKLKAGGNFAALAKSDSGGPTASAGGDLGDFKRGALGSELLENATFPLPVGGNTAPIRTRQGFVILHVDAHQASGVPPLSAVEAQVQEAVYVEQMAPALRTYLTKSRDDAYVDIAPGFVDAGSPRKSTKPADIAYTAYVAPAIKKKVQVKQRVEQEKADKAQADLAAARAKVAEKQAAKDQAAAGTLVAKNDVPAKPKKIHREKIRFGQAPQNALPAGTATSETAIEGAPLAGQAPGVAMAPTESVTTITTGVGADTDAEAAGAPNAAHGKTRFASHESDAEIAEAKAKLAKAESKASARPVAATPTQTATEKVQAAPLGLNGDTTKKPRKPKHQKGDPKERLQDTPAKPADTTVPVAPTVNPALATGAGATSTPPAAATPPASTTPPNR